MMQFEVEGADPVAPGVYRARLLSVTPTLHADFGEGTKFAFQILDGELAGKTATRICGAKPTPKNALGRLLASILGQPIAPGMKIDIGPYINQPFLIRVEPCSNGTSTRITGVSPAWTPTAPSPSSPPPSAPSAQAPVPVSAPPSATAPPPAPWPIPF